MRFAIAMPIADARSPLAISETRQSNAAVCIEFRVEWKVATINDFELQFPSAKPILSVGFLVIWLSQPWTFPFLASLERNSKEKPPRKQGSYSLSRGKRTRKDSKNIFQNPRRGWSGNAKISEDCSRASTRKICPKQGPRKSHDKATKKPRKRPEHC